MLSLNSQIPDLPSVKSLSTSDLAIMSYLSNTLKKRLLGYFEIDSFTMPDPVSEDNKDFKYFIVVDKSDSKKIVSFIAIKGDDLDTNLWDMILGKEMSRLDITREELIPLKQELMPKDTNNFYPIRKEGSIFGFIAPASEICGLK